MPKALCLTGLVVSILVFLIFFLDLLFGLMGAIEWAPLKYASMVMDIVFIICSAGVAFLSWQTFREQR